MQMCPDNAKNQGKKSPFTQDIFGFLLNKYFGLSINTMTLGGLAIALAGW